jgi:protein-disulfide isomerase
LGITGTPAFVINEEVHSGALDKSQFDAIITRLRKQLKTKG